jgi:hypothetical protein
VALLDQVDLGVVVQVVEQEMVVRQLQILAGVVAVL